MNSFDFFGVLCIVDSGFGDELSEERDQINLRRRRRNNCVKFGSDVNLNDSFMITLESFLVMRRDALYLNIYASITFQT